MSRVAGDYTADCIFGGFSFVSTLAVCLGAMSPFENMSPLNVVVGIIFILLTLLLLIPGALASLGNLPGNKWFGLHVPAVRKDRAIWDLSLIHI